jgi:glycosyltransferase involved in cell wall biosynthesis
MISVIIPTFNEERALPETLGNLLRQAGDFEVIVVDGGSVDHTVEIVRGEPRVRFLTAPKGRASQMNTGAQHATGDWLLFLHADTVLPEGALAHINTFETDSTVQIVPPVITDSRKFVQMGIWRSVFRASLILFLIEVGLPLGSPVFFREVR